MTLLERQRHFRDYLRDLPSPVIAQIAGDAEPRMAVYHNAFRARLDNCLRDAFAKCWAYLGDAHFADAIGAHRIRCEPHSWTLDAYGADFDQTLAMLFPDDPEIAELAWLEWALRRAFDGPDAKVLTLADLTAIDWDNSVPRFHPTFRMCPATTNAAAIWLAIDADQTPPPATVLDEPTLLLVWRKGLVPQYRSANGLERRCLLATEAGQGFGVVCADVGDGMEDREAISLIGAMFNRWISDELIVGANPAATR